MLLEECVADRVVLLVWIAAQVPPAALQMHTAVTDPILGCSLKRRE